jgi:hypothetical protein
MLSVVVMLVVPYNIIFSRMCITIKIFETKHWTLLLPDKPCGCHVDDGKDRVF